MTAGPQERMRRWRLILGGADDGTGTSLGGDDVRIDAALSALYDSDADQGSSSQTGRQRGSGLAASAPRVARWLGDIRTFFPVSVVQVMQKDAIERVGLTRLLLEPEMLDAVEPDVHLVGTLLALSRVIPEQARESARAVVRTVTTDLERRLAQRTRSAVAGALNRASRTSRPRRHADIDWDRTIRANLRNYLPRQRTIVPERLIGYARKQQAVARDVIICLDQSGSMASSVVYAGVFGAVLASIRSLRTSVVAFDTSVVDLTDQLSDPVDVLFGTQIGGGTDINRAVAYCQQLITRPASTIFVLISDLYEGGNRDEMLHRIGDMTAAGTQVIALLALSDDGAPGYDHDNAAALAGLGVPAFACTPDLFPDLMAAAIERRDIAQWAYHHPPFADLSALTGSRSAWMRHCPRSRGVGQIPHWFVLVSVGVGIGVMVAVLGGGVRRPLRVRCRP
jgi:Mg-chelatase subunit ChlD